MATQTDRAMGALVKRYREAAGLKQEPLAEMLSRELGVHITQNRVSDLERGERWTRMEADIYGALCRVLNIPQDEVVEVLTGFPPPQGEQRPMTLQEIIERDPSLSDAAKAHLINQYGLLQLASQQERASKPIPPVASPARRKAR